MHRHLKPYHSDGIALAVLWCARSVVHCVTLSGMFSTQLVVCSVRCLLCCCAAATQDRLVCAVASADYVRLFVVTAQGCLRLLMWVTLQLLCRVMTHSGSDSNVCSASLLLCAWRGAAPVLQPNIFTSAAVAVVSRFAPHPLAPCFPASPKRSPAFSWVTKAHPVEATVRPVPRPGVCA